MLAIDAQLEADLRAGTIKYVPRGKLACGGMAEVWRGEAELSDGQVLPIAFKRVLPDLAESPLYRQLLQDEARIGMLLRHPNIVRVYGACELHGSYVIVMELVEGASLREALRYLHSLGSRVPVAASLRIAHSVALALAAAHEATDEEGRELSVVHCDVSPHNVLLADDGTVKLMDFGLASSSAQLDDTERLAIGGKPGYLAPELILWREVTPALDLFALGVMLWECLTGQRLFQGRDEEEISRKIVRCDIPPVSRLVRGLPRDLDDLLSVLLAREPERRQTSARELASELEYLAVRHGRRGGPLLGRAELRELVAWTSAGLPHRHSEISSLAHPRARFDRAPHPGAPGGGEDLGVEASPFESERESTLTRPRLLPSSGQR